MASRELETVLAPDFKTIGYGTCWITLQGNLNYDVMKSNNDEAGWFKWARFVDTKLLELGKGVLTRDLQLPR